MPLVWVPSVRFILAVTGGHEVDFLAPSGPSPKLLPHQRETAAPQLPRGSVQSRVQARPDVEHGVCVRCPSPRDRELAIVRDVPLTRPAFVLPAAFEPAVPSAAAGMEGWKMHHNGEKQQMQQQQLQYTMNQRVGSHVTLVLKKLKNARISAGNLRFSDWGGGVRGFLRHTLTGLGMKTKLGHGGALKSDMEG